MIQYKAFGTFYKSNGQLFRNSAYLQFGYSSQSTGSIIMLNPGGANFINPISMLDGKVYAGELVPDKTMLRLAEILYQTGQRPLNGRFHIYNLFSIQNTSSKDAIKQDSWLNEAGMRNVEIINQFLLEQHPWVILAWSTEKGSALQKLKEQWLAAIEEINIKVFGIKAEGKQMYYHPCPRIPAHKERYMQEIKKQLQQGKNISLIEE